MRRRSWWTVVLVLLAAASLAIAVGCSLFHHSYPDDECEDDRDCFQGQETCVNKKCVPVDQPNEPDAGTSPMPPDAAPSAPDAMPGPPDAGLPDGAP